MNLDRAFQSPGNDGVPSATDPLPVLEQQQQASAPQSPFVIPDPTDADKEALRKCRSHSFWFGGLPMSIACQIALSGAEKLKYVKPHPRYGMMIKNAMAIVFGYCIGKALYMPRCRQIFAELDTPMGEIFRDQLMKPKGSSSNTRFSSPSEGAAQQVSQSAADSQQFGYSSDSQGGNRSFASEYPTTIQSIPRPSFSGATASRPQYGDEGFKME